jgi:hypothetical protein
VNNGGGDFDLASVYPRRVFDDLRLTIEQCDLVPNSNVLLIPRQSASKGANVKRHH